MPLRLVYIQTTDITGPDASATVQLVDRDDLDRDSAPINFKIPLKPAERQMMRDIKERAELRMTRRVAKARADKLADPTAPVSLAVPVADEDAP